MIPTLELAQDQIQVTVVVYISKRRLRVRVARVGNDLEQDIVLDEHRRLPAPRVFQKYNGAVVAPDHDVQVTCAA